MTPSEKEPHPTQADREKNKAVVADTPDCYFVFFQKTEIGSKLQHNNRYQRERETPKKPFTITYTLEKDDCSIGKRNRRGGAAMMTMTIL